MGHANSRLRSAVVAGLAWGCGAIPAGVLVTRSLRPGLDLRRVGTGNVGTSNIFRNAGLGVAALVGPVQFAQGLGPVLLARRAQAGAEVTAVAAVAGSCWPVPGRRTGGRGQAVLHGAVAGLSPAAFAGLLAADAAGLASGHIARGVLAGVATLPLALGVARGRRGAVAGAALLGITVVRRLDGAAADITSGLPRRAVLVARLLDDARPGQSLTGPVAG